MKTYGVIMAGGGGTRFWPLSRQEEPKQLLNLSGKERMINETIDRVALITDPQDIFIVTNKMQAPKMREAVDGRVAGDHILSEPSARNTAACIGYAAFEIMKKYGDGVMCIFPSDHFIKDREGFRQVLNDAVTVAENEDALITLGIKPTFPSTGYGYIKYDRASEAQAKTVLEFKEKPDAQTAKKYVESGAYAWNSGMFIWKASTILKSFETLLPEVYAPLKQIADAMQTPQEKAVIADIYPTIPGISIDYGIMEKSRNVVVITADIGWNDVGSWDNLGVLYDADMQGNVVAGDHLGVDTTNSIIYAGKRLVTTVGVDNLIVVETEDAVLVCAKDRAQDVKKIVDELRRQERTDLL